LLKRLRVNNRIRLPEVQVIDENGKQLGTMRTQDALQLAREKGLDLVEVGPNVRPPITKVMDYGKYMYQKEKKEKQSGSKRREQETKTVRVGYKTGEHDLRFKAKKVDEFLEDSSVVKVELTLRGREKALAHLGRKKLITFLAKLTEPYIAQGEPRRSPFGWVIMIQKDKRASSKQKDNQSDENKKDTSKTNKSNTDG